MSTHARPDPEDNQYTEIERPPSNSHKNRMGEKKVVEKREIKQLTTKPARTRKKGVGTRIKESFTGDDARSVGGYLLFDVAVPALQNLVVDAFQQGVERLIMGDSRPNRTRRVQDRRATSHYQPRHRTYSSRPEEPRRDFSERSRSSHDFDQIVLDSRGEAEEILDYLGDILNQYEVVSVTDLYRMVGIRGSYMDDRWGWTHLRDARARRVRDGYVLELPTPIDLDRRV